MPKKFTESQKAFPESCSFADCDTFPDEKNREDLKSFGYHKGEGFMREIEDDDDWKTFIADTDQPKEYSIYVQNVRKFTYQRPWQ
jgi:hypothetical protein